MLVIVGGVGEVLPNQIDAGKGGMVRIDAGVEYGGDDAVAVKWRGVGFDGLHTPRRSGQW